VNVWQTLRQLKYLLLQRQWEGSGADVFQDNSVVITVAPDEQAISTLVTPTAIIRPMGAQSDPVHDEQPDLILQSVAVRLSTTVPGDALGEYALIGGGRQGQTDSRGRGLLEVEEELFAAIGELGAINGMVIYNRAKSAADAELDDQNRYSCFRSYMFEMLTTEDRYYESVTGFVAADKGDSTCDLTWAPAPLRFDSRGVRILRVSGGTPTTNPADGSATVVLDGSAFPSPAGAKNDSSGAGTFSYTIWNTYDEFGSGTTERYSAPKTSTVTVA
tara:strand:+ start:43 stop:864 length:822 start_codon:yes stop_codon:yes gene_type:complete